MCLLYMIKKMPVHLNVSLNMNLQVPFGILEFILVLNFSITVYLTNEVRDVTLISKSILE